MNSIHILYETKQNVDKALKGGYINCQFHSILVIKTTGCLLLKAFVSMQSEWQLFVELANYIVLKVVLNCY